MQLLTVAVLCAALMAPMSQQLTARDRALVESYRASISDIRAGRRTRSMEQTLALVTVLQETLAYEPRADGHSILEAISDGEFETLERKLPGLLVSRSEVVFILPDADFFLELANTYGDRADQAFFSNYKGVYPDSVWASYIEQHTDVTGCIDFKPGQLTTTYKQWQAFRRTYPGRYTAAVRKQLDEVEEHIAASVCACGDPGSVAEELSRFLELFPRSRVVEAVKKRLTAIKNGSTTIRFNCSPG